MEYRDLYDKDRNLIGKQVLKKAEIPENTYLLIVLAFIQNYDDKFLIQFTSKEKGSLYSSTGGHAKTGESSLDAIVTEVHEELGVLIDREEFELFFSGTIYKRHFDLYYLKKNLDIDKLNLQKEEVSYVKWMTKEEIYSLIKQGLFLKSHADMFEKCFTYLDNKSK